MNLRRVTPPLALLLLLTVGPAEAELPDLSAVRARIHSAEDLGSRAEHVGRVAMRMQNELTSRIYARSLQCDDATSSLLARQRHLGHVYRDLLQAWRVEVARLHEERELAVVAPLLQPSDLERIEALDEALDEQLALWRTAVAWQRGRVEPWASVCGATLRPDEGLATWSSHVEPGGPTLVIGVGSGKICPAGVPAEGAVVIVEDGLACYADGDCACEPQPVGDGAVLGPNPVAEADDDDEEAS